MTRPSHFRAGLGALVLGAALVAATLAAILAGLPGVLLVAAACALCAVIALVWASLTRLAGDQEMDFQEALSLAAPTAEEEQKRAVLRALKDLEYELSVGKISREDFEQASAHYRAEARRMIALSDAVLDERRREAQRRFEKYAKARLGADGTPAAKPEGEESNEDAGGRSEQREEGRP